LRDEGWEWALIVGRLAPGVTREHAGAELQAIFQRQRVAFAANRPKWSEKQRREYLARTIELVPGGSGYSGLRKNFAGPLSVLAVVVGLVLLIGVRQSRGPLARTWCGAAARTPVRAAARRGSRRLVRQLVTESLLLAVLGGLAGSCSRSGHGGARELPAAAAAARST